MTRQIQADWKISKVLADYPDTLETLIGLTPAFERLRNPVLRRVQSRLITVRQAAGIAGLDVDDVIAVLNGEARSVAAASNAPTNSDRPAWADASSIARELDVREMIARGEEPFGKITAAARAIDVGDLLVLAVGFEPVPLYDVLANLGFIHWAERDGDAWRVWFLRQRAARADRIHPQPVETDTHITSELEIDVSELTPPQPMMRILAATEALESGQTLRVLHLRQPVHLFPQLEQRGLTWQAHDLPDGRVEILISRPVDA